MKIIKRLLLAIFILVFGVAFCALSLGFFADTNYKGNEFVVLPYSADQVWTVLDDTERYSSSCHEVKSMRMLPSDENGLKSWEENTGLWGTMTYQIRESIPAQKMVIEMTRSDFGLSGFWTFLLTEENNTTKIELQEESEARELPMRSILSILGRKGNMKLLLRALEKEVKKTNL